MTVSEEVLSLVTTTATLLALTTIFTLIAVLAEILAKSFGKAGLQTGFSLRSFLTLAVFVYFLIALLWSSVGTLLAFYLLQRWYPVFVNNIGFLHYFLSAFVGVFLIEFVMSNTNVSVFGKGVLAFQNWMTLVRDPAIASATNKQAVLKGVLQDKLKDDIALLPSEELEADLLKHLGTEELERLDQDATGAGVQDHTLYKVMRLVELHPNQAKVLSKRAKRRRKEQKKE